MKLPRNAKVFRGQLDVAPFMGVFLLLLMFVMLQRHITFMPGIPVTLPEAADLAGIRAPAVTVVVDDRGRLYFDQHQLESPAALQSVLTRAVTNAGHAVTLVVQSDRNVPLGAWTDIVLAAREAGINEVLHAVRTVRRQ